MKLCPCGSLHNYSDCCGAYIEGKQTASTAEQLMRSRYTAFVQENWTYIKDTMLGKALQQFTEQQSKSPTLWLGLDVLNSAEESIDKAQVEFIAKYLKNNNIQSIHEKSEFIRQQNRWFYIDGQHYPTKQQRIPQNSPCPCGSHKKFKNCHG